MSQPPSPVASGSGNTALSAVAEIRIPPGFHSSIAPHLRQQAGPGPGAFQGISLSGIQLAAAILGVSTTEAMISCLYSDIWPLRFARNRGVLTRNEQIALLRAHVAIIGCGGLGGYVANLLARAGVGVFSLCDYDVFDESNLNRQLFCGENSLGRNKAEVCACALREMASHAVIHAFPVAAGPDSLPDILAGADIVVDCLDLLTARRALEEAAHGAGLPFVHGAVAGEEGFVMLSRPGKSGMKLLYGNSDFPENANAESRLGVPPVPPAIVGSLQAHLAISELLGKEPPQDRLHHLDLTVPLLDTFTL